MKKVICLLLAATLVAISLFGACAPAPEKPMKLHIASWNVPADPNTKVLEQIAADLEEATGGMVTAEICFQALGKPGDYYNALVGGLCDIAYIGPPYSPGRFPLMEMALLPTRYPDTVIFSKAYYELWRRGYFDEEFSDVKVFAFGGVGPSFFLWRDEPVTTLASIKGKKISAPSAMDVATVEALGGVPVSMPVTDVYMAMETGVIDGALNVWQMMPVFRFHEVVKYATLPTHAVFPYIIAINKDSYKKLPKEAKAVIDDNSEKYSLMMGQGHKDFADLGKKMFLDAGGRIDTLSPAEIKEMHKLYKPIFDKWVSDTEALGLPAEKVLGELYSILVELGIEEPFVR